MRRNPRRNPWIRAVVTLLIAAMLVTNNTAATFAGEISQDETIINTVTDQEDTGSENVQQEPEGEKPSGEEAPAEVPVDEKPAEEEPSGEGPLGEGPAEDASSDEIIGENEAEDGVPDEDVIDEGTLELDGSVVIDEAHGEVGQIIRYSFRSFSNQSRTDYYHRYYNQLGAYGKEIYDYLEEHAEDFIEQDPTVENYKPLELKVYGDTPVSYEELQNFLRDVKEQIYYAYAAFDYDHPEVFWLNTDSFIFQYGRYSNAAETKFYPVVLFACDEKFSSFTYYDRNACDEVKSEIQGNVNTIVAGTRSQNGIKAKLTVINDWLSNNNYYNRYVYQGEQADPRTWKSAAALTAQTWLTSSSDMGDPKAPVCEAYSRAFKMVCDEIGIPCILVPGDGHMWNYVQNEDGVWYAMDVTWDDPVRWDECTNRITPDFWIHRYIMVGSQTVVSGKNQTFQADGHRPNGVFWTGGKPMPTPGISETAYEEDLSAQISNLSVLTGPDEMQISYDTDRVGTYYYVLQTAGQDAPSVYEIQDLVSDIENGSGYGTVTKKQAEEGTVTFSAPNPPEGTYDLYLIQLTTDEYISPVLHLEDLDPDLYVGWRRIDHKDYYFCPENYEGWEDNLDAEGNHVNDMGAMATSAVWIKDVLYKFGEDGACEKIWHRIKEITLEGFAEPEPQIVLQRGRTRQLSVVYTPEEDNLPLDEITDNMRVTWTSSDPQTVSVDSDGTLHALQNTAAGVKVRITGTTGDSTNKYHPTVTLDVTVTHPEGWFMVEGNRFFGKKTGDTVTLVTELQEIEGKTYYFYPGNDTEHVPYSMATGIVKIDGQYYDFGENGVRISDEAITNGFVTHGGETYYFAGGERQIGIHKIGSHYYGFDNSGAMYRDAFFKRDNGGTTRYYFAGTDGILATGTCYASEQGVSYFADEDYAETNAVPVCSMQSGIVTLADGSYYFSVLSEENGAGDLTVNGGLMQYGYFAGANGKHYYALPKDSANAGKLQSGWVLVENAWKLFGEPDSESPFAESDKQYTNGWIETGATGTYKRYYVDLNGKLLSGWQTVDGNRYYFDIDGAVASGFRRIGKSCYLFGTIHNFGAQEDDYGILLTGLRVYGGHTYYADAGGVLQLGWQKIDGIWRYFDSEHGYEIEAPVRTDYWFTTDDGKYYFQNGTVMVTGVRQIDGAYYYFSTNKDDGSLGRLICSEFITVGKNTYYADENGVLQSGLIAIAPPSVYAGTYYLDENRILQTGFQTIAGKNYYDGRMAKGWFIFRNDKYYATEDGSLQTAGLHELNTRTYCFDASGKLLTGWQVTDPATGSRRYFNDVVPKEDIQYGAAMLTPYQVNGYYGVTENGEIHYYYFVNNSMLKGWQTINGKKYCFGTDGCLQTGIFKYNNAWYCTSNTGKTGELGAVIPGLRSLTINGVRRTYNCDTNGKCLTGWQKIDGKTYYFNPVAGDDYGAMLFGRIKIGTKYYFTDHDGVKQTNTFINSYGETYFANASGVLLTGFQTIKVAGNSYRFYFDTEGRMKTGWTTISNAGYYFCPDGAGLPMGAMLSGLQEIGGKDYYFNTKGVLQTGWQKANNAWNYYATQADVTAGRTDTLGEICDNVDIDTPERYWRTVTFENGDQSRFFIKNNATVLKGWQNLKVENVQRRYYFDSVSGEMYKGLSQIGNASYRLHDTEGYVLAEGWENNCYFNAKGQMLTGWQTFKVNGVNRVLYLNPEDGKWNKGEAASATGETFIIEVAGKKYRLDADGYRFTVACSDDGYYSDKNGLIKTGWQKINNVWCYYATPEDEAAGRVEKWGVFCPDTPEGYLLPFPLRTVRSLPARPLIQTLE